MRPDVEYDPPTFKELALMTLIMVVLGLAGWKVVELAMIVKKYVRIEIVTDGR